MRHIFYNTKNLTKKKKKEIIDFSYKKCFNTWVDILDCNISWRRQTIDMSYKDVMKRFNQKCHFVIIDRYDLLTKSRYGEVGFNTLGSGPEYFLYILVTSDILEEIVNKYKLNKIV
jgi:hypothetical protein